MLAAIPVVERTDDGDMRGVGSPHAKGDSVRVRNRSHPLDLGFIAHGLWLHNKVQPMSLAIANAARTASPPLLRSTTSVRHQLRLWWTPMSRPKKGVRELLFEPHDFWFRRVLSPERCRTRRNQKSSFFMHLGRSTIVQRLVRANLVVKPKIRR